MPSQAFIDFINKPDTRKIWLMEMERYHIASGVTDTFRISTDAVDYNTFYYHPHLKTPPQYSRTLEQIFWGRAQYSIGRLELNNMDGDLDWILSGEYAVRGRRLRTLLGGEDLSYSDLEIVMNCIIGDQIEGNFNQIYIEVLDNQHLLDRRVQSPGTYSGLLPDLVKSALTGAGYIFPDDFNMTLWNQFDSTDVEKGCRFQVSVNVAGSMSTWFYIEELTKGLRIWHSLGRDGKFCIAQMRAPVGAESVASYGAEGEDLEIFEEGTFIRTVQKLYWSIDVGYGPGGNNASGVTQSDSAIKTKYIDAEEGGRIMTSLELQADATTIKNRIWALQSVPKKTGEFDLKILPLLHDLGDVFYIKFKNTRYGVDGYWRVIGISENSRPNHTKLIGLN